MRNRPELQIQSVKQKKILAGALIAWVCSRDGEPQSGSSGVDQKEDHRRTLGEDGWEDG